MTRLLPQRIAAALPLALLLVSLNAWPISFELLDGDASGVLNTSLTVGGAWRMHDRSSDLVGKSNLNPSVCRAPYQSCQGLFLTQTYPSDRLHSSAGAASLNGDDGNLNYDKGDLVQGLAKVTQDLNITWGDFGLFARWLYFYDAVNNDFTENHPNRITPENYRQVGITGDPIANRYFERVYGPGGVVRNRRIEGEALRQIGANLQWLDANVYGKVPFLGEHEVSFKIGRQTVNWGESTLLVINSINQAQPVNANNLYRIGFAVEEVFTPVGSVFLSTEPFDGATLEGYYQYEWLPVEAPAAGGYFGFADLGTNNLGDNASIGFGGTAEDPAQLGFFQDNPLALITPTTTTMKRRPDKEARDSGQFGLALKYYAETLGNGTELAVYFMNYHSKLPYVSFYSANASCARREGNSSGIDARNTSEFLHACNNLPAAAVATARNQLLLDALDLIANRPETALDLGADPLAVISLITGNEALPYSSALALDSVQIQFEYPEDLQMYGFSFNTTVGDYSLQGELAYRPDMPLQVSLPDLAFAALGPTLSRCHDRSLGCAGSSAGSGFQEDGTHSSQNGIYYGSSDFVDGSGANPYPDTINILLGHMPGSARAFPSFVIPYRGGTVGENPPNSYIRGWEPFDFYQLDLGFTRVLGATDNWIGADQIQLVGEFGMDWIPGLPGLDELQIEAAGNYTHASAGADGSGADGSRQACSTNPSCSVGADGIRFNPFQADLDAYVDELSWGYRLISIIKYESVLPGISIQPFIVWAHDVQGTAPGPAENFIEGRKQVLANIETRYKDALSVTVGYGWFFGAGEHNLYRDRDFAQAFVKYQF
ncbi:MAG TPA: DUF1302 family protein [Solimonas sp.]|nr:DUF1302 family protein [Solimonas sp.]